MNTEDLIKKTGNVIQTFKKGDHIIRVVNAILTVPVKNENLRIDTEVMVGSCGCCRKEPVEYIGIYNNLIYVRSIKKRVKVAANKLKTTRPEVYKLDLTSHEAGWAKFEIPEGLTLNDCL